MDGLMNGGAEERGDGCAREGETDRQRNRIITQTSKDPGEWRYSSVRGGENQNAAL